VDQRAELIGHQWYTGFALADHPDGRTPTFPWYVHQVRDGIAFHVPLVPDQLARAFHWTPLSWSTLGRARTGGRRL
jgi:hypothetical protein